MKKILCLLWWLAVLSPARAQVFDTLRVQGALMASPFDPEPRSIDTLIIVLAEDPLSGKEPVPEIILKYARIMGVDPSELKNEKIYQFVDDWLGTPYRYGGESKRGVDCSALTRALYTFVSEVLLPRSSRAMYASEMVEAFREPDFSALEEGDLLFFRSRGRINHVAVYLCDGKFLSANRNGGVQISDLKDAYWRSRYYSAGRVKTLSSSQDPEEDKGNI